MRATRYDGGIMAAKKRVLTSKKIFLITQMHYEGYIRRDIAEATGVSSSTVWSVIRDLKSRRVPVSDDELAELLQETYQRYLDYEEMAIRKGGLRTALDCRNAIVKLFGLAKPEKQEVSGSVVMRQMQPVYMSRVALGDGEVRDDGI